MVPGHEAIGTVRAIGAAVTKIAVGMVVGFGPQRDSCAACEYCKSEEENLCSKFKGLYDPDLGFLFPAPTREAPRAQ